MTETASIVIVGTGFAGLGMAIRLKQAGIHDFVVLEAADEVGGTWRDNRYPGVACDVEAHLYSYSFEPNPSWTRAFAPGGEILDYLVRCATKYAVRPHVRFRSRVRAAAFDATDGTWRVETDDGAVLRARVLVAACGGLSRPAYPEIEGLERFAGAVFHSARWDEAQPLAGRSIAVVGTGASAIQIVPALAPIAARLSIYQRTPPWILPKPDRAIRLATRERFRRWPLLQKLARVATYWRRELTALGFVVAPGILKALGEPLGLRHLNRNIADPALRAKLRPAYPMGCKRILIANDYHAALERPHVEVITTAIRRFEPDGIVTEDGAHRPADVVVLATGFRASEMVAPFDIRGRDGQSLERAWAGGAEAYLGTTVHGFPNLFVLVGPNTGLGHSSMVFMIESQIAYVVDAVQTLRRRRLLWVDVKADVQERYNRWLHARLTRTVWASGCTSWYRTPDGKNTTLWPGFTFEYRARTRRFDRRNYELVAEPSRPAASPVATTPRVTGGVNAGDAARR